MASVKIVWAKDYVPGQIYGEGVEMALCSAKNEQIGPFVYCKDFFQDAIKGFLSNTKSQIYGYVYDPATMPPIDLSAVRILLRSKNDKLFNQKATGVLDLLNQVEQKLKLPPSKMFTTDKDVVLLVGDKDWLRSSASLGLYTLLIRNGLVHEPGVSFMKTINDIIDGKKKGGQRNDYLYLKFSKPGMQLMIDKGLDEVFGKDMKANYKSSVPTRTIHHYGGSVAFGSAQAATKSQWPHWKYPEAIANVPSICFS